MYVARLTDRERKDQYLTLDEYKALRRENYSLVLDGFAATPVCYRLQAPETLAPDEFRALAKLVRAPGVPMSPQRDLFDGQPATKKAAIRRFEQARKKVEPTRPRGGGTFRTVDRGDDKRYVFEPNHEVSYCLLERLDPAVPVSSARAWSRGWSAPDSFTPQELLVRAHRGEEPNPSEPEYKLIPRATAAVEGLQVRVQSFAFVGRHVRARVTVSNTTQEPKVVSYFVLHVGEKSLRAVRPRRSKRRRRARATAGLEAEMLVVRTRRAVAGFLFFPRPLITGNVEAAIRPYVIRSQVVG